MMTLLYLGPAPKSSYRLGIEARYLFRPNDKAIALDMNKQGSGGFFSCSVKEARVCSMSLTLLGDVVEEFPRNKCRIDTFQWISCSSL